jgi:hypothetical protein
LQVAEHSGETDLQIRWGRTIQISFEVRVGAWALRRCNPRRFVVSPEERRSVWPEKHGHKPRPDEHCTLLANIKHLTSIHRLTKPFCISVSCLIFSIYLILPAALGPGVYSASNRNEYQKQKNNVSGE